MTNNTSKPQVEAIGNGPIMSTAELCESARIELTNAARALNFEPLEASDIVDAERALCAAERYLEAQAAIFMSLGESTTAAANCGARALTFVVNANSTLAAFIVTDSDDREDIEAALRSINTAQGNLRTQTREFDRAAERGVGERRAA